MFWILGFVLLFMALLIPILAIVVDSPVARTFMRGDDPRKLDDVLRRIETLETEMSNLEQSLEALREETQFVQRLLKAPDGSDPPQLSPPES